MSRPRDLRSTLVKKTDWWMMPLVLTLCGGGMFAVLMTTHPAFARLF